MTIVVHSLDADGTCLEEYQYQVHTRAALHTLYDRIERGFDLGRHMVTTAGVYLFGKHGHHEGEMS